MQTWTTTFCSSVSPLPRSFFFFCSSVSPLPRSLPWLQTWFLGYSLAADVIPAPCCTARSQLFLGCRRDFLVISWLLFICTLSVALSRFLLLQIILFKIVALLRLLPWLTQKPMLMLMPAILPQILLPLHPTQPCFLLLQQQSLCLSPTLNRLLISSLPITITCFGVCRWSLIWLVRGCFRLLMVQLHAPLLMPLQLHHCTMSNVSSLETTRPTYS